MFDRLEEARFRLESSVVMFDGAPVYVHEVFCTEDVDEQEPVDSSWLHAAISGGMHVQVSELSWDFPQMGWAPNSPWYYARRSVRQYRFGLTRDNMSCSLANAHGLTRANFFPSDFEPNFHDLMSGKKHCENYDEALDRLNEGKVATLSPTYLLNPEAFGGIDLYRHRDLIAKSFDGRRFYLKEEFMHYCDELSEQVKDDGVFFEAV